MAATVVLTGGASGVGAAVLHQLAEAGCAVHVLDISEPDLAAVTNWVPCDLGSRDAIERGIDALPKHVDALVNVAGVAGPEPAAWVLRVNFLGLRHLTERLFGRIGEGGSVVSVSSVAGREWRRRREVVEELLATSSFEAGLE